MNRISKTAVALLLLTAVASPAAGQGVPAAGNPADAPATLPADEAIDSVRDLIETETRVATASRINADYVPGILTVLLGSELEERGWLTVGDAVASVPGVTVAMSASGEKRAIVRGVGSTYAPSTLKMMLNGVSLNSSLSGKAAVLFDVPSEQVERIEIIRGPGAVLYGEYASAGVINVITRQAGSQAFARAGSAGSFAGGALLSLGRPERELAISLNVAGWDAGNAGVSVSRDKLTDSPLGQFSRAPGETNEEHQNFTGVFALSFRDFALSVQFTESTYGDYFGFNDILPDSGRGKVQSDGALAVEAGQTFEFSQDVEAHIKLGWLQSTRDWTSELIVPGVSLGPEYTYPDGLFQNLDYRESRTYGETGLSAKIGPHALLAGLGASYTSVVDADLDENGAALEWIPESTHRRLVNVFLQDEFEVTDHMTVTGGLRYDTYSDVGDRVTPRLSAVYRIRDRHILKVQYAEAFRPPVFSEVVGFGQAGYNSDIGPELTRTLEGGYIFKTPASDARLTLFHSKIEGLIVPEVVEGDDGANTMSARFVNAGSVTVSGGEAELVHSFGRTLSADANVSYARTEEDDTGEEIEGAASWLGNLGLVWRPHRQVAIAATNRYVGKRHRYRNDTREDLAAYDTVDLACSLYDLPFKAVTVRAGVRNLLDADVSYPSISAVWEDDLERQGRQWWIKVGYSF